MSYLLTDPTCVLVVGDESVVPDIRTTVLAGRATEVIGTATVDEAIDVIDARDDVGCVVVTDRGDATVPEACEALQERNERLPIVAYTEDESGDIAHRATRAGATEYVPASTADEILRERVDEGIRTYESRRWHAEESDMFSAVLKELDLGIYVKDDQARHLHKSSTSGDLSEEELFGKTDLEAYGSQESYEEDLSVVNEGRRIEDEVGTFETENGRQWTRTTKVPWRDEDGTIKGLVGTTQIITNEIRRKKELEHYQERLDRFVSYITHDIRNPVQIAQGYLDLARERGGEENFEQVEEALERISEILDDLSTITDGEFSESVEDIGQFHGPTGITDIALNVWSIVTTEEATLINRLPDNALINAPEANIRPIFENLFKNAITHAGDDVTVEIGPLHDGFYVADDGPGIPEEEREDVLKEGYTTAEEGTGTGLSIIKEILDRDDWDMEITEGSDSGARFEIRNCPIIVKPDIEVETEESIPITDHTDVGSVTVEGSTTYDEDENRWEIAGSGRSIYMTNEFHYAYATVEGPVRLQGRIEEVEDIGKWSMAGLMVRDDLQEEASYGFVGASLHSGTGLLWRSHWDETADTQSLDEPPRSFPWYRLDRIGETVTMYFSSDGAEWYPLDQRRVEVTDPIEIGLAVCSSVADQLCHATFDDVSLSHITTDQRPKLE